MLHSCDVQNCEDTPLTMVEKGEIQKKERKYYEAGTPNDVSYKGNAHITGIAIHYFPKDLAVWTKWTRFDRRHRGDLLFNVVGLMLRSGFEDACYERIPPVKSREDNQ